MKTCLQCKHFHVNAGEQGWYPGEHQCMSLQCEKKVWFLEQDDLDGPVYIEGQGYDEKADARLFRRTLEIANHCEYYLYDKTEQSQS